MITTNDKHEIFCDICNNDREVCSRCGKRKKECKCVVLETYAHHEWIGADYVGGFDPVACECVEDRVSVEERPWGRIERREYRKEPERRVSEYVAADGSLLATVVVWETGRLVRVYWQGGFGVTRGKVTVVAVTEALWEAER